MDQKDLPIIDFFAYSFKRFNIRDVSKLSQADFIHCNLSSIVPSDVYNYMLENGCFDYEIAENSGMGYRFRMYYPNLGINIMSDGITDMHGLHVVLSGNILSLSQMGRESFKKFRSEINDRISVLVSEYNHWFSDSEIVLSDVDFLISRCDIAYDFNVAFEEFFNRIDNGFYHSSFRKLPSYNVDTDKHGTIYLGNRQCSCFVRIYDKYKEIHDRNKSMLGIIPDDLPEDFTRVEFEFKNEGKRYRMANEAFTLYCDSAESIGNLCYRYLQFYNDSDCSEKWDTYESVILYNNTDIMIEYNKLYQTSINVSYLIQQANMLTTYCRRIPGLINILTENLAPSKSALRKTANITLDANTLLKNCREIVNEQEIIILEHLTFFHNDLTGVELDPNKKDFDGLYDYYFSNRLTSDQ